MKSPDRLLSGVCLFLTVFGVVAFLPVTEAFSQTDFYKGKTIKIIRGGGPGGSGEFQTRALMRILEKHIPGKPSLLLEFIPGAAGRKAANVIYSSTKPDGLTIGSIGAGLVVGPILGLPGSRYDLDKFIYLGSTDSGDPYVFYTKGTAGLDTLAKLRAASGIRFGAHAVGHPVYVTARMVAYILGLKDPKFVTGFTGPAENQRPITSKRTVRTMVRVKNNETVVIGGLVRETDISTKSKVFLLGDIPLLGALFTHHKIEKQKTDLLIFITPRLIDPVAMN